MTDIKVFGSDMCGACVKAKEFLDEEDVEYEFKDVLEDKDNVEEFEETVRECDEEEVCEFTPEKKMSIPMIKVGDEILVGFDENKLSEAV